MGRVLCAVELWQWTTKLRPWNQAIRWIIRILESAQGMYYCRKAVEKGGGTGMLYSQKAFISLLAFPVTGLMGVRTVLELPTVWLAPVVRIDRVSPPRARSVFLLNIQSLRVGEQVGFIKPLLMVPVNRSPKASYFQLIYQIAIKVIFLKTNEDWSVLMILMTLLPTERSLHSSQGHTISSHSNWGFQFPVKGLVL